MQGYDQNQQQANEELRRRNAERSTKDGEPVEPGAALITLEAMKMETVVRAPARGIVKEVVPSLKTSVQAGDLLVVVE